VEGVRFEFRGEDILPIIVGKICNRMPGGDGRQRQNNFIASLAKVRDFIGEMTGWQTRV